MSSFFGKLRGAAGATNPSIGSSPTKKDGSGGPQTALEKLLSDAGPVRTDGTDKFFGMENFGNTCYCNSILQCLFYSIHFRELVIQYPKRTPADALAKWNNNQPRASASLAAASPFSPKPKTPLMSPQAAAVSRKTTPTTSPGGLPRPEDIKDTPEWKKKQAILAGPILQMDYDNSTSYGMPETLFTALKDLFEALIAHNSRTGVVSPQKLLEILKRDNEAFRGSMHQDAHEFLNLLLNEVVTSVDVYTKKLEQGKGTTANTANEDGLVKALTNVAEAQAMSTTGTTTPTGTATVHDLFEGTLTSETRCLTCENVSQRDEIFLDLSVDLEEHSSITSCLQKFSQEEMLCERNKFHCDNCGGLQEAEKRMKIKRLPRILALHLKRFKYTEDLQRLQKLFHRVVYPDHLRLLNTTDDAPDQNRLYELYAVVVHIGGGPYHGHYVSIVKTAERGWLLFDDELVEPVDESYVRNFFGDRPGLACAYVLFYQEISEEDLERQKEAKDGINVEVKNESAGKDAFSVPAKPGAHEANGFLHTASPNSPPLHDGEQFAKLDQSLTAPAYLPSGTPEALHASKSPSNDDLKSKKEKAREEKEQKAAEKQRTKDAETRRKEIEKQLREQAKQARAEEEQQQRANLLASTGTTDVNGVTNDRSKRENGAPLAATASGVMHNSLSRFKQGSKSINKKFWSKDKEEPALSSLSAVSPPEALTRAFIPPTAIEEKRADNIVHALDKAEKPKSHRFSLKKKSSTLLS